MKVLTDTNKNPLQVYSIYEIKWNDGFMNFLLLGIENSYINCLKFPLDFAL